MSGLKRLLVKGVILAMVIATVVVLNNRSQVIPATKAGSITSPAWALSSTTLSDTNVTYTHTFTTETAVPSCNGPDGCGGIEINMSSPPTTGDPFPDFSSASVTVSQGATNYIDDRALQSWNVWEGQGWLGVNIQMDATAMPAGATTVTFTGVTNPEAAGIIETNTLTSNNGTELDGRRNGANGKIKLGTASLSGKLINASATGISGMRLEVHTQFGCQWGQSCFWQTTSETDGTFEFVGIPAGTYVFEISPGMDLNNANAAELNQYSRFDPMEVTIPAQGGLTLDDITLTVSQKIINGTVKYAGTNTAVSGANVNAFSMGQGGFAMSQTGADGSFQLKVASGKTFFVMVMPNFGGPDGQPAGQDFMPQEPRQVSFQNEGNVAETLDLGIIGVEKADATVTGTLKAPDGSAVSGGGMGAMNFQNHVNIPVMLNFDGTFSFQAKSGTGQWSLERFDPSSAYTMPETQFSIRPGANNLGTITMLPLDGRVTVTAVQTGTNTPVSNLPVMAFRAKKAGPPFMAFTNSSGVATINVPSDFEGRVMAEPGGSGGPGKKKGEAGPGGKGPDGPGGPGAFLDLVKYAMAAENPVSSSNQLYPLTPPQKVSAGGSVTIEFGMADKQVLVQTLKGNTTELMTDGAFINARPVGTASFDDFGGGFGGPTSGGIGTLYTPSGEFEFNAFFPPESDYIGVAKRATITTSGTSVDITTLQKTVTVTGEVQDASNNNAVIKDAGLQIMIGIFGSGAFGMGSYDPNTGRYSAKFAPGVKFRVGVAAGDPGRGVQNGGYIPNIAATELEGTDGQTITHNVSLAKVDAVISGTIKDQNGAAVEGVNVFADPGLADIVGPEGPDGPGPGGPEGGPEFGFSAITDATGAYSINVSANKYNLIVNARDQGLFTTGIVQVDIAARETKTADISLARADSTLQITAKDAAGNALTDGEVQIFNDKGTIAFNAEVADDGTVSVPVPADTYTIRAGKDTPEEGKVEKSSFIKVLAEASKTTTQTLQTATQTDILPKPLTQEIASTSPATVLLQKGGVEQVSLEIPSGALTSSSGMGGGEDESSSSGNPILSVSPIVAQTVATKVDVPIKGVTIDATDSSGNAITTIAGMITGKIAYTDGDLPSGVAEANLEVKSFNENSGQWEKISSSSVDAVNNTVTFATTHLTDFAIVATADTNAPTAPTSVAATAGDAKVTITWTNPTDSDLAGIKIYRSTASGTVGDLVTTIANTTTTSYENTGLTNGTRYYYVVRSYDTAGNISTNTTQVNAVPQAAATAATTTASVLPVTGAVITDILDSINGAISGLLSQLF